MSERTTASYLLSVWRRIAPDADRSLAIHAANEFYKREIHDPESLQRLVDALGRALSEIHTDFAQAFDYSWIIEPHPDLYHPAAESLYQLHVIDCAATLWDACPPENRESEAFSDLMARYSRLWGGVGSTSPKARNEDGVRFVIVPFGWDQHLHIALDGLMAFSPSLMPEDVVVVRSVADPAFSPEDAIPSWNALLARALATELGCHELLTPLCVQRFVAEVPQLQRASSMRNRVDVIDVQLSRCSLAMLFSIAHEVGHHLSEVFPSLEGEDTEVHADRLAMNALWGCPGSARSLKGTDEPDDTLTLLSGGLFFAAVEIGVTAEHAVRCYVNQANTRSASLGERMTAWVTTIEQIVLGHPELRYAADAAYAIYSASRTYSEEFAQYLLSVLGDVLPIAREIVDELHKDNPDLHDIPLLERRLIAEEDESTSHLM
ncbi:MAG: hypothetical protein NCW75_04135 [Phycisphaera sp.]|nr:MAG: hypothetical protein NCW75_04135 [Phycisphaera sp.]